MEKITNLKLFLTGGDARAVNCLAITTEDDKETLKDMIVFK